MKLLKHRKRGASGVVLDDEKLLDELSFDKFKFTDRPCPKDPNEATLITCFSEFGVESLAIMYSIPLIKKEFPNHYFICVGWHGREYLYRHIVDEYWAIKEKHQWLREYSVAFMSSSKNILRLEKSLESYASVYGKMTKFFVSNTCNSCGYCWSKWNYNCNCLKCSSSDVKRGIVNDVPANRHLRQDIPLPSQESISYVKKYLKPNSVGIFARNRACYGRNLGPDFYSSLILFLREMGYDPIWLGERQSTLSCPLEGVTDFRVTEDANNLELTLALISQLKFTVQFWTASTRLASIVGTPWLLFESPDQIVGNGQEGIRIALTSDYNKKKIILADYNEVAENNSAAIPFLNQALEEIKLNNWDDIIGPVRNHGTVKRMLQKQKSFWGNNDVSA